MESKGNPGRSGLLWIAAAAVVGVVLLSWGYLRRGPDEGEVVAVRPVESPPLTQPASEVVEVPALVEESAAASSLRTTAEGHSVELLLLDHESKPVVDAKVVFFRELELLAESTTNTEGLANFPPLQGRVSYAIAAWGWDVVLGEIEFTAPRATITLTDGLSIDGMARVDGAAPAPFEIQWKPEDNANRLGLPQSMLKALIRPGWTGSATIARTQSDGSFQFRGLRHGAKGTLNWQGPYVRRGVEPEYLSRLIAIEVPRLDVVLDLVAVCEMRLRVVDPSGKPSPRARVRIESMNSLPKGERFAAGWNNGTADPEGRYRHALSRLESAQHTISVAAFGTEAWQSYPRRSECIDGVWDLGDLAIPTIRTVTVHVQDEDGSPIPGAEAFPWTWPPRSNRKGAFSDIAGVCTLEISADASEITVEKFTFTSALLDVPAEATEVTATLQRSCMLEFELSDPSHDRKGLSFELSGRDPMFDGNFRADKGRRTPSSIKTEGIVSSGSGGGSSGRQAIIVNPEKDARWRVAGLLPDNPLRVKLRGNGTLVCELEVPPLAPGEQRSVTIPMPVGSRALTVRVLSPELTPVPHAEIHITEGDVIMMGRKEAVDANGEVHFASLYGEKFEFGVEAKSFAPARVSLRPIPEGRYDVVLESAHSMEIELVERSGAPYVGKVRIKSTALPPSFSFKDTEATKLGAGLYRVDGLPYGNVAWFIHGDFGVIQRLHDAREPRLRIVVDEPGSIDVTVGCTVEEARKWRIEVAGVGSSRLLARSLINTSDENGPSAGFSMLPAGEYEVWLVLAENTFTEQYARVGSPVRAVIDAQNPSVKLAVQVPR